MQIIKKINTSAALALDSTGQQVVVLGKGIGFPPVPYELTDLSKIERTFYDVDPKYLSMIRDLPQSVVMVCAEISDQAEIELDCRLNPNLPFTLADHVQFAMERLKNGIDLVSASTGEMAKRYGFVYVDADDEGNGTFDRYKKDSFDWYKKVIASNGEDLT